MGGEYRQYTSNPTEIVLEFQPGRHTLSGSTFNAFTSQLVSFTMKSVNTTEIYCTYTPPYLINDVQKVHISGINFINCRYRIDKYYQVALYIGNSSVTIRWCSFTNNNNMALYVDSSSMVIDYSSFIDNMASKASISIENGHHKNVTISNSEFSRNTGNQYGHTGVGALSVFTSYLELYNTTFVSNRGRDGGTLAVQNMQSIVNISRCNFVYNKATLRGGAVFTTSSFFITIQQSTFSSNRAGYLRDSTDNINGGAIHLTGMSTTLSIQQSRFLSNQVGNGNEGYGGAIYVEGSNNSLSISQSELGINQARNGGAVSLIGDNSHILLEESSLSNNQALAGSGGAVYTDGQNIYTSITASTISKNLAAKCGALAINKFQHYNVKFENSMFIGNGYSGSWLLMKLNVILICACVVCVCVFVWFHMVYVYIYVCVCIWVHVCGGVIMCIYAC